MSKILKKVNNGVGKQDNFSPIAKRVAEAYVLDDMLRTDPQGSYTGQAINKYETPVQDADDL